MLSWTTDNSGTPSPDATRARDISDAQMGVAQSEISRIEKRHDMLLSTLTSYLSAAGEHPTVVVTVNGQGRRTGLDDLGRRTLGLDTASKFAAGRVTTASISRPDVGRSRAVRVQQAGVKTDHSQPRQIGPRSVDGGSVSDSQADSAGSIPVTRSIREQRCNTSESVDSRPLPIPAFGPCAGHIGPQISTPQHSSSVQKDAPPVPSRSPAVRPVFPTAPRVYLRKHELDVNGLNYSTAKKHD